MKNQTVRTIRKSLAVNHNQSALAVKVCMGIHLNHNESALAVKVHQKLAGNHNESALAIKK